MKNGKNNTFLLGIPARKPLCVRTNHEKKDDLTLMCSILSKGSGYPSYRTLYFYLFIFCHTIQHAGILVPRPGIEPLPPAVEAWSPNHWITREVPLQDILKHSWIQVIHHLSLCPTLDCKLVFRDHKKQTLMLFTYVKEFRYSAVHLLQMLWCCLWVTYPLTTLRPSHLKGESFLWCIREPLWAFWAMGSRSTPNIYVRTQQSLWARVGLFLVEGIRVLSMVLRRRLWIGYWKKISICGFYFSLKIPRDLEE